MNTVPASPSRHPRRWPWALGAGAAAAAVVGACEAWGWPFLAEPMQGWLTGLLGRRVDMAIDGHMPASARLRLIGRLELEAPSIEIGTPSGGEALRARDAVLVLRYSDIWHARHGEPLRIHSLRVADFDGSIERLAAAHVPCDLGQPLGRTNASGTVASATPADSLRGVACVETPGQTASR